MLLSWNAMRRLSGDHATSSYPDVTPVTRIVVEPVAETTKIPRSSTARNWDPSGAQTGASGTGEVDAMWATPTVPSVLARPMRNPVRSVPSENAIVSLVAGAADFLPAGCGLESRTKVRVGRLGSSPNATSSGPRRLRKVPVQPRSAGSEP